MAPDDDSHPEDEEDVRPPLDPDDTSPALREPRPFRPCQPDVRLFPLTVWNRLRARRLRVDSAALLHYQSGLAMGLKELRQALAAYLRDSRGVECDWRQVAITSGSQQALFILGQLLLDAGDRVLVEDPGYPGARNAWLQRGATPPTGVCAESLPSPSWILPPRAR